MERKAITEDYVFSVEKITFSASNEELTAVRVFPAVGLNSRDKYLNENINGKTYDLPSIGVRDCRVSE